MTEIVLEQRIAAPPATVYRYLTEEDKWVLWQGVAASFDAREGGLFSAQMPNGMNARGRFVRLVPDQLVVFTWGWVDRPGIPPGSTEVEISLEPDGDETVLVLTHRSIPDDEASLQKMGWTHYLPRLAAAAEGKPVDPDTGLG
ncbi:MAG: SRPBCC domain-containing protein [Acidimicrobiia bacterium]|nr:SRPBCC domain-containing protein [Acidimicrobiia bacterium]MBT8217949.1 SRPBCC domain-containing protein [Acidimicrobiia bacterium]NNF08838.1 SRPBCC domain-containing protein [Acidimicrobiia bacterium]NNL70300.1 SRPBCC domain-containing protein [Acidimicrobiia bacterium]